MFRSKEEKIQILNEQIAKLKEKRQEVVDKKDKLIKLFDTDRDAFCKDSYNSDDLGGLYYLEWKLGAEIEKREKALQKLLNKTKKR